MINLGHIPNKLPGRHPCECQARVHPLIRNCLGCGRIVCEQEGSGPCIFCGKFVCTREERNIIENDPKKGLDLERKLMKQAGYGSDLGRTKQEEEAQQYRDMLLKADRESVVRNKVFDLDSDYYSIETSNYLTTDEKKAIQKRKEELKQIRGNRARRAIVMDLDFEAGTVRETNTRETYEKYEDEIIQDILRRAEERRAKQGPSAYKLRDPTLPSANKFTPRFNPAIPVPNNIPTADQFDFGNIRADKDQLYADVERKGYYLAFQQPLASKIVAGHVSHLLHPEEVAVQGPIYIVSQKSDSHIDDPALPELSIIGKIILTNCITTAEFREEHPEVDLQADEPFVLLFEDAVPLEVPLPYVTSSSFGQLPKPIRDMLNA